MEIVLRLLLFFFLQMGMATPQVSLTKPKEKIFLASPFELNFRAEMPPGYKVHPSTSVLAETPFYLKDIKEERKNEFLNFIFTIMPFEMGKSTFPSVTWIYETPQGKKLQVESPSLTLNILPFVQKTPRDILDIEPPVKFYSPYYLALIILLIILVLFLIARAKIKSKKMSSLQNIESAKTPYQKAIEKIINAKQLWDENRFKEFYTEISDAVREYATEDLNIFAMNMTTQNFLRDLRKKNYPPVQIAQLKEFLEFSDLVKFAKLSPSQEDKERDLEKAKDFVKAWHSMKHPPTASSANINAVSNNRKEER